MLRSGYILGPRLDWLWFLGFPYLAIAAALACHTWLPAVALASIALWITIPHHLATWLRTYGLSEDWQRWKGPLIAGPLVALATAAVALRLAPQTFLLVILLWDHQHSLMQQHGLARIYDFKAGTGGPLTGRYDLLLNWFLYVNMLVTAPLFVRLWGPAAYQWGLELQPETVVWMQRCSWTALALFFLVYARSVFVDVHAGRPLNPAKYFFIGSSYFLWYFTSWHTDSFLVFGIAHRLMHGVQYMVIVHSYLGHKCERSLPQTAECNEATLLEPPLPVARLMTSHRVLVFVGMAAVYALLFQFLVLRPLDEFGFGVVNFMAVGAAPQTAVADVSRSTGYDLFAASLIQALPVTHYYFDSFIWKVRDARVQEGL